MFSITVYLTILVLLTIITILKKSNRIGILLLILYSFVAVVSTIAINKRIFTDDNVKLLPLVFLIISYLLFFNSFLIKKDVFSSSKLNIEINKNFYYFAFVYIVSGLVYMWLYIPGVVNNFRNGNWLQIRRDFLEQGTEVFYHNKIQYIFLQFNGYFRVFAIVLGFILLRKSSKKIWGILLIFSALISEFLASVANAARGSLVLLLFLVLAIYFFFAEELKFSIKFIFIIFSIIAFVLLLPYFLEVTMSRNYSASNDFFLTYFGMPPVVFCKGVWTINTIAWGKCSFGRLFGIEFSQNMVGGSWNTGFFTFVGLFYIDWGWFGTIIVGLLFTFILRKIINKEIYKISDVYLIFYFYKMLVDGVFVLGRSFCYQIIGFIITYLIIRFFIENVNYTIGTKSIKGKS